MLYPQTNIYLLNFYIFIYILVILYDVETYLFLNNDNNAIMMLMKCINSHITNIVISNIII